MNDDRIQQLQQMLDKSEAHAEQALGRQLGEYDPIDLAELLEYLKLRDKARLFKALGPKIAAEVLDETDRESREQILSMLSVEQVADLIKEMPLDEGADIIQQLSLKRGRRVLDMLGDAATELEELITYPPDTAGGIMTTDCLWGKETEAVAQVLARIGKESDAEHVEEVFVLDRDERLQGVVSIKTLLKQSPSAKLNALMNTLPFLGSFCPAAIWLLA